MFRKMALILLMCGPLSGDCFGGFVLSVGSSSSSSPASAPAFAAGTTGTMGVYVTNTSGFDRSIRGVLLGLDFAATKALDGLGTPSVLSSGGISFSASSGTLTFGNSLGEIGNATANFDRAVNIDWTTSGNAAVAVAAGATVKLFDINLGISPSASPGGQYGVFVRQDASGDVTQTIGSISYQEGAATNIWTFANNGSDFSTNASGFRSEFTVTAVPEPSSMILAGLGIVGWYGRRKWRSSRTHA